ncbi:MAG: hypothetical protein NTZ93_05045 [Candidatus Beckwithbacteria bacterium]|nr:hypothetical protein [Candidatus Beckwithbacteria bacterium]
MYDIIKNYILQIAYRKEKNTPRTEEATVEVNRDFNPLAMTQYEFMWQYNDIKGQYWLAFPNQVSAVKYQFNLSEAAATKVVQNRSDNTKYFNQLFQELGIRVTLLPTSGQNWSDSEYLSEVWATVYEVEAEKLQPLFERRVANFKLLDGQNPNWNGFRDGLLAYYEGLKAVITAQPEVAI